MSLVSPSLNHDLQPSCLKRDSSTRILLIEDNEVFAGLMHDLLASTKEKAFVLEWAPRLDAGLERLAAGGIDVVLLDLSLPDSEGLATFLQVHAHARHLPIVVLTGSDDETLAVQTLREGAQDYIVKTEMGIRSLSRAVRYAIERKRLEEKLIQTTEILREKNAEMEADLHMARELQQGLLLRKKRAFPESADGSKGALQFHYRYQPTTSLAGDFFDVIPISETSAGVLIADVMGHGVRAALVTAIVRGLVEELTPVAHDPGQFLTEINRGLTAILHNTEWPIPVSAFYLVADISTGKMRYANAAHPDPICLHRDSGIAEHMPHAPNGQLGPILGVVQDAVYSTGECQISPRDMVILYTDGLYEAENQKDESFGHQRLMDAASDRIGQPGSQLFDGLLADVRKFTGHEEFADDVCLVGVEIMRLGEMAVA
jgi:phosphoserine phosphatase RsbU/P